MANDSGDIPPDVTAYLDDVAQHLRGLNGGKRIPAAWKRYLSRVLRKPGGKKRGRPQTDESRERHETIARRIFDMQMQGLSWEKIASAAADDDWHVTDLRALQRIYNKYFIELAVEELRRRLPAADQSEEEERRSGYRS